MIDMLSGSEAGRALLFALFAIWPLGRMLRRAGRPPALACLVLVPVIGLTVVLAILAVRPWPTAVPDRTASRAGRADRAGA